MAVSNTTPIIYLAKIRKLDILKNVYESVFICSPVWEDIVHLYKRVFSAKKSSP